VEQALCEVISEQFWHRTDENSTTHAILIRLRELLHGRSMEGLGPTSRIIVNAFKQRGKDETNFGDIAIWIRLHTGKRSIPIEGVGYLEAKIIDPTGHSYKAFKQTQIQLINTNAPQSYVLCYDNVAQRLPLSKADGVRFSKPSGYNSSSTQAIVIPTGSLLARKTLSRRDYTVSCPFSVQLCQRYLFGLDLEHPIAPTRNTAELFDIKHIPFVLVLDVLQGNATEPRPVTINREVYAAL